MKGKTITYSSGIFDQFKGIKNLDRWSAFPEIMGDLGYEMDCCKSFEDYCKHRNVNISSTASGREERKYILYMLENADRQIVGNYLFSIWRYYTHWASQDEYGADYVCRIIRILEDKYAEESKCST